MTSEDTAQLLYGLLCIVLVGSSLLARRLPLAQSARMALAWAAIFAVIVGGYAFWGDIKKTLYPEAGVVAGETLRIPMSDDGHFWVRARVNGADVRFLVDSGATTTALSQAAIDAAGISIDMSGFGAAVETANGTVVARRIVIDQLEVGPITRRDVHALTASEFGDTNLLGMNFLSSMSSWSVEERTLVLRP